ncbi:MAG: hypothetical protein ACK40O_00310 [Allosphingosinicella sp.]
MPSASFDKSPDSDLYVYSGTGTPVAGKAYTVGFLQHPGAGSFPPSLSLAATWADAGGLYLFFQDRPADEAAFVEDLRAYVAAGGLEGSRFVWIGNSAGIPALWEVSEVSVAGSAPAAVSRYAEIRFQNYALCLDRGLAVSLSDPSGGAAYAAFVIAQSSTGEVRLKTGSGDPPLEGIGPTVEIPMEGSAIGCLRFRLTVAQSATAGAGTEMGALGAGISFYYPDPEWDPSYVSRLTYPLIDPSSAPVDLYPCLDPLNPLLPARSLFGFLPPDGGSPQALSSYYRTWVGRSVGLVPRAGAAPGFALSPSPRYTGDSAPPLTLAPNGGFTIRIAAIAGAIPVAGESESATRIMCGLSPVEYVGYVPPQSGSVANVATFYPGNPAYAASFDPGDETSAAGGLSGEATTAYVAFTPDGPPAINYYSQPDQSVYYDPSAFAPPQDASFLDMKEIIAGQLAPGPEASMPMAAFAGLPAGGLDEAGDQALHARFEVKVISQARRDRVQSGAALLSAAPGPETASPIQSRGTTRHGMLGFFGAPTATSLPIVKVQLAQSGAGAETLVLGGAAGADIGGPLKQALQSSQLFLVMSDAALFAQNAALLSSTLKIAGIPFDLDPGTWADNGTIIVYKYAGASIANLAADLGSWSFPANFTDGGLTQSNLLAIIQDIRDRIEVPPGTAPDPNFLHIYEAVTDPAWNGIIAFNSQVSLAAMPSQLAGIAGGIDPSRFRAHHLGINISPMTVIDHVLTMQDTALFGLINYVDDAPLGSPGGGDAFKVSMLKILFGNSEIRDFACRINLLVTSLFGSTVRLLPDGAPAAAGEIVLDGYYQRTASGDAFSFSSARDLHFKAASEVLDEVEIVGADFVTLNPDSPPDPGGTRSLRTQFVFAGRIRFHDVPGFDALSYGDTVGPDPVSGGLSYSNLIIHMDYDLTAQGVSQNRVFRFDAQNLAIDVASSAPRPQSLVAHFPLKFKSFVQGQSGSTPAGLGYLAAATPVTESPLTYPWFALQYELNLGTFGALASSAGFTASVLIGWSAAPGPSVYTGVKIPGASPENLSFSIEGLLGLSIDDIRFTAAASPQGSTAYTLVFTNLALRFFGIKIPHSAYVDLILFGNPDPSKRAASLGWYAAYTAA